MRARTFVTMNIQSWGGGVVLAVVAALWLVYLIPSWHRRQEYLATERNAVRLQQTLRILAQTSELPEEIHIEANAKSVATAQKILQQEQSKRDAIRRAQEAARQRAVTRELAATAPVLRAADDDPVLAARRLRRTRLITTLVLALSILAIVIGITSAASAWLLIVAGVVFGGGAVAILGQLAAVSRARARRTRTVSLAGAVPVAQPLQDFSAHLAAVPTPAVTPTSAEAEVRRVSRQWTPVAVPQPLYLSNAARSRATAEAIARSTTVDPAAELQAAAKRSVAALREAQLEALRDAARAEAALSGVRDREAGASFGQTARDARGTASRKAEAAPAPVADVPRQPRPDSRFARMGIIDEIDTQALEIDEVLRRRRAV